MSLPNEMPTEPDKRFLESAHEVQEEAMRVIKKELAKYRQEFGESIREVLKEIEADIDISGMSIDSIFTKTVLAKALAAAEHWKEGRFEGKSNDLASKTPGITIYLTTFGKDTAIEKCYLEGCPIEEASIKQYDDDTWGIDLPEGGYFQHTEEESSENDLNLFAKIPPPGQSAQGYFSLNPYNVIRIEGHGPEGTLWQNPRHNWDGTPKNTLEEGGI